MGLKTTRRPRARILSTVPAYAGFPPACAPLQGHKITGALNACMCSQRTCKAVEIERKCIDTVAQLTRI